jgi:hypothetical protein
MYTVLLWRGSAIADLRTHVAADLTKPCGYYANRTTWATTATALDRLLEGATTTLWQKQFRYLNKKQLIPSFGTGSMSREMCNTHTAQWLVQRHANKQQQ